MKKTQIKLIEKARKEGASPEVLTLLSREDFTVRMLTDLYSMTKNEISVKDIESIISMNCDYYDYFYHRLYMFKNGYTQDEIRRMDSIMSDYYEAEDYAALNAFRVIIDSRTKNESDSSLRVDYARFYAEYSSDYDMKEINFAIANHIPVDVFKREYALYEDGYAWISSHLPGFEHLLQGVTKRSSTDWEMEMTSMSSDEIKTYTDAASHFHTEKDPVIIFQDRPFYRMDVTLSAQAINIKLAYSSGTRLYVLRDDPVCCNRARKDTELVAFFSGDIYVSKNKKLFPLSMKQIGKIYEKYGELGHRICDFLFTYTKEKLNAPVMADLYRTLQTDGFFNIPIAFNDCRDMHNCNQLLKYRWKNSSVINWNKADINVAYAVMKSLPFICDIDKGRLLQHTSDEKLLPAAKCFVTVKSSSQYRVKYFLREYIVTYGVTNAPSDIDLEYTFTDYCNLCNELHEKVSIGFKSYKKLVEAHNDMSKRERNRLHKVSVPKDSRFNELRKLLPKDFEWVKGGKRLQQEGITMNHCVNSYYTDVNMDKIAIYHLAMSDGYKATIAFIQMKNGKYRISQMFGYHNEECPQEVWDYVHGFLRPKKKGKAA